MPTVPRFRNFRVVFWPNDHPPAHVHALGPGVEAAFWLGCDEGPVTLRFSKGTTSAEESALIGLLSDNLEVLCSAWREIHDSRRRT